MIFDFARSQCRKIFLADFFPGNLRMYDLRKKSKTLLNAFQPLSAFFAHLFAAKPQKL